MRVRFSWTAAWGLALLLLFPSIPVLATDPEGALTGPSFLAYQELIQLSAEDDIPYLLKQRLDRLLHTPIVSHEFGVKPRLFRDSRIGSVLRVAQWNIERGLKLEQIKQAFIAPDNFLRQAREADPERYRPGSDADTRLIADLSVLRHADVIVLNEADLGLKRTNYQDVTRELAQALGMNYAYAVEFVEVDPITLGVEQFNNAAESAQGELRRSIAVDTDRYLGLHGTAILSRLPIRNARIHRFQHQGYDWYRGEKKRVTLPEWGRRQAADKVFLEKVCREVRRGGRMALIAELDLPELPEGQITIVATHLENRAKPEIRRRQLGELLAAVKDISRPVILAGDMNTQGRDERPMTLRRELFKRVGSNEFWATQVVKYMTPLGMTFDLAVGGVKLLRTQRDPTGRNVFLVGSNPEQGFFKKLQDFRFADGRVFDFRGDEDRTINGTKGTLANSNQRATKGFAATFRLERTIGPIGEYKLDWIFVKAYLSPGQEGGGYRFAPHFPRTLEELNRSLPGRLSDHSPITVDLPLAEPGGVK